MKFEKYNLSPEIKKNLENLGFKRPTDIQFKSIPGILKGQDVLAIAQTGTGKTAAFAIPAIHLMHRRYSFENRGFIRCIVMVPTHELAIQITEVFSKLCYNTGIRPLCVYGGTDQAAQISALKEGVEILIATPGRMFDLASQGHIDLNHIELLILDEADHMLNLGFIHDIRQLIAKIPKQHQTLFFSATIDEVLKDLAYSLVRNPLRIQLSPKDPVSKNVNHSVIHVEMDDKRFFLERFIREHLESKMLVFVRTQVRAERVCKALERVSITSETIHGGKEQLERSEALNKFREGTNKILIATDVSARGIDIPDINYVINYDIPEDPENYVHRVGRTGRGMQKGIAISFCSEQENDDFKNIENYIQKEVSIIQIKKNEYDETIVLSEETPHDWRKLIDQENEAVEKKKKKKKSSKK